VNLGHEDSEPLGHEDSEPLGHEDSEPLGHEQVVGSSASDCLLATLDQTQPPLKLFVAIAGLSVGS